MAEEAKTEQKPSGLVVSKGEGGDFETTPEGQYTGRCYRIIDLGTQDVTFKGETKKQHKILISWELIGKDDPRMEDGRPFAISKMYTASLHERATLHKDLNSWRGKKFTEDEVNSFDLKDMLGTYCQIQVTHRKGNDETVYANVDAIMATKESPEGVNDTVVFELSNPDWDVFENLSDKLQERIKKSPEYKELKGVKDDASLDDIPF